MNREVVKSISMNMNEKNNQTSEFNNIDLIHDNYNNNGNNNDNNDDNNNNNNNNNKNSNR